MLRFSVAMRCGTIAAGRAMRQASGPVAALSRTGRHSNPYSRSRGSGSASPKCCVCARERERAVWSRCTWCQYVTPLPLAYVDPRFSIPLFFIGALALYESYFLEPA